jgi:hypothetical protein
MKMMKGGESETYLSKQLIANAVNGVRIQNLFFAYCTLLTDKTGLLASGS